MTVQRELVACLVCGSTAGRDVDLGGAIRRCGACDFGWTVHRPAPGQPLAGYGYFDIGQRRFEAGRRLRWLTRLGRPASLVEAGSAGGFFLQVAERAGIDAEGIEVAAPAVRFAREQLGVAVRHGRFEDASFAIPVDAVCAFDVLEHVDDPHEFLLTARQAVRGGGRVVLEVPNIASAAAHRLGAAWPTLDLRYHRWHFTPDSLTRLVVRHGFQVSFQDTVFSRYHWRRPARLRNARDLLIADWVASRSPRVSHPVLGDLIRLVARRPEPRTPPGRPA